MRCINWKPDYNIGVSLTWTCFMWRDSTAADPQLQDSRIHNLTADHIFEAESSSEDLGEIDSVLANLVYRR